MRKIDNLDTHIRRVFDPAFLVQRINFVLRRAVVEEQQRSRVQAVLWDRADDRFFIVSFEVQSQANKPTVLEKTEGVVK